MLAQQLQGGHAGVHVNAAYLPTLAMVGHGNSGGGGGGSASQGSPYLVSPYSSGGGSGARRGGDVPSYVGGAGLGSRELFGGGGPKKKYLRPARGTRGGGGGSSIVPPGQQQPHPQRRSPVPGVVPNSLAPNAAAALAMLHKRTTHPMVSGGGPGLSETAARRHALNLASTVYPNQAAPTGAGAGAGAQVMPPPSFGPPQPGSPSGTGQGRAFQRMPPGAAAYAAMSGTSPQRPFSSGSPLRNQQQLQRSHNPHAQQPSFSQSDSSSSPRSRGLALGGNEGRPSSPPRGGEPPLPQPNIALPGTGGVKQGRFIGGKQPLPQKTVQTDATAQQQDSSTVPSGPDAPKTPSSQPLSHPQSPQAPQSKPAVSSLLDSHHPAPLSPSAIITTTTTTSTTITTTSTPILPPLPPAAARGNANVNANGATTAAGGEGAAGTTAGGPVSPSAGAVTAGAAPPALLSNTIPDLLFLLSPAEHASLMALLRARIDPSRPSGSVHAGATLTISDSQKVLAMRRPSAVGLGLGLGQGGEAGSSPPPIPGGILRRSSNAASIPDTGFNHGNMPGSPARTQQHAHFGPDSSGNGETMVPVILPDSARGAMGSPGPSNGAGSPQDPVAHGSPLALGLPGGGSNPAMGQPRARSKSFSRASLPRRPSLMSVREEKGPKEANVGVLISVPGAVEGAGGANGADTSADEANTDAESSPKNEEEAKREEMLRAIAGANAELAGSGGAADADASIAVPLPTSSLAGPSRGYLGVPGRRPSVPPVSPSRLGFGAGGGGGAGGVARLLANGAERPRASSLFASASRPLGGGGLIPLPTGWSRQGSTVSQAEESGGDDDDDVADDDDDAAPATAAPPGVGPIVVSSSSSSTTTTTSSVVLVGGGENGATKQQQAHVSSPPLQPRALSASAAALRSLDVHVGSPVFGGVNSTTGKSGNTLQVYPAQSARAHSSLGDEFSSSALGVGGAPATVPRRAHTKNRYTMGAPFSAALAAQLHQPHPASTTSSTPGPGVVGVDNGGSQTPLASQTPGPSGGHGLRSRHLNPGLPNELAYDPEMESIRAQYYTLSHATLLLERIALERVLPAQFADYLAQALDSLATSRATVMQRMTRRSSIEDKLRAHPEPVADWLAEFAGGGDTETTERGGAGGPPNRGHSSRASSISTTSRGGVPVGVGQMGPAQGQQSTPLTSSPKRGPRGSIAGADSSPEAGALNAPGSPSSKRMLPPPVAALPPSHVRAISAAGTAAAADAASAEPVADAAPAPGGAEKEAPVPVAAPAADADQSAPAAHGAATAAFDSAGESESTALVPAEDVADPSNAASALVVLESYLLRDPILALLDRSSEWDFELFQLHELSGGHSLLLLGVHLLRETGMLAAFPHLDLQKYFSFFRAIESSYNATLDVPPPYHNDQHGADVMQGMAYFMSTPLLRATLQPLDVLAGLVAAACHDYEHLGRNNVFMVATGHRLALLYNDTSVMESHHASASWNVLLRPENYFLDSFPPAERAEFRASFLSAIAHTDMSSHMKSVLEFEASVKSKRAAGGWFATTSKDDRRILLDMACHVSDLGNPAKPMHLAREWTARVVQEFWAQGDDEKAFGLKVSPMMDREKAAVDAQQFGFIDFVVGPLFNMWGDALEPLAIAPCLEHLQTNKAFYKARIAPPPAAPAPAATPASPAPVTAATTPAPGSPAAAPVASAASPPGSPGIAPTSPAVQPPSSRRSSAKLQN